MENVTETLKHDNLLSEAEIAALDLVLKLLQERREEVLGHSYGQRLEALVRQPAAVPTMVEAERDLIRKALESTGGNKLKAARLMGISRHRLYDKLRKFGALDPGQGPPPQVQDHYPKQGDAEQVQGGVAV